MRVIVIGGMCLAHGLRRAGIDVQVFERHRTRTDGLQGSIKEMDKRKDAIEARLERVQAAYLRQFNALDTQLAAMSTTSSYLAQQLANLPKINASDD